jgi:hypothetical protein
MAHTIHLTFKIPVYTSRKTGLGCLLIAIYTLQLSFPFNPGYSVTSFDDKKSVQNRVPKKTTRNRQRSSFSF